MSTQVNWENAIQPLLEKYKGKQHPLDYKNTYQLIVMVVLSAQDSDRNINKVAPKLFEAFPNLKSLSHATDQELFPYISGVRGFRKKTSWLLKIANELKDDKNIPLNLEALVKLPGIGRKSANVILRESGTPAQGIIVDLHVVRVAPRLGIVKTEDPTKIEKELMEILPQKDWDAGMAMSFLGRGICRPTPQCPICLMKNVCEYFHKHPEIHLESKQ